jgi:hypothetical protein
MGKCKCKGEHGKVVDTVVGPRIFGVRSREDSKSFKPDRRNTHLLFDMS